jgi:hypothetical protein
MRSQDHLHRAFFGDPSEPGYPRRLAPYQMEQLARAQRAIMLGELIADAVLWAARLPGRLLRLWSRRRLRAVAQRA